MTRVTGWYRIAVRKENVIRLSLPHNDDNEQINYIDTDNCVLLHNGDGDDHHHGKRDDDTNMVFIYKLDRFNQFKYYNHSSSNISNDGDQQHQDERTKYLCYQYGTQEILVTYYNVNNEKMGMISSATSTSNSNNNNNAPLPQLIVSSSFSRRYQLKQDDIVHVKSAPSKTVMSLDRVVLMANDPHSFEIASLNNNQDNNKAVNKFKANQEFKQHLISNSTVFQQSNVLIFNSLKSNNNNNNDNQQQQLVSYKIIECFPLLQGCINAETTLIIISPDYRIIDNNDGDSSNSSGSTTTSPSLLSSLSASTINSSSSNNTHIVNNNRLRLSNFIIHPLSQSLAPFISSQNNNNNKEQLNISPLKPQQQQQQQQQPLFHFTPNSKRILSNNIIESLQLKPIPMGFPLSYIDPSYDYIHDAIVTISTLKQYGLFHGAWIKLNNIETNMPVVIRIYSIMGFNINNNYQQNSNNNNNNLVQLLGLKDGFIHLPPLTMFNLGAKYKALEEPVKLEMSVLKNVPVSTSRDDQNQSSRDLLTSIFPLASRVRISRIKSVHSTGHQSYTNQLFQYFEQIKIIKQGDIFIIHNQQQEDQQPQPQHQQYIEPIYFKIESIQSVGEVFGNNLNYYGGTPTPSESDLYVIDREKSTLIQEGSSQSLLPSQITSYQNRLLNNNNLNQDNSNNQLLTDFIVYEVEYNKIVELINSFLQSTFSFDFNCSILIKGAKGIGKRTLVKQVGDLLGLHVFEMDCMELYSFIEQEKEVNVKAILELASESVPCILLLSNFEILEQSPHSIMQEKKESNLSNILKETIQLINDKLGDNQNASYPFIVMATVNSTDDMSGKVRSWFKYEMELNAPDEKQRNSLLRNLCRSLPLHHSISIDNLAMRTASFLPLHLRNLIERSAIKSMKRVINRKSTNVNNQDNQNNTIVDGIGEIICNCGINITNDDVNDALTEMQGYQSTSIGAPKIPNVKWEDVGGLANVKSEIMDTIQLPLENPHLFASGIGKRSGILLYGPPGTGKTLLAKAIATECSLNFLSVKGPELINMYIGESEKNIREIFNKARQAKPCVIFFDELDSLAPSRGAGADSGGVMDRVVSQLLAELDGMQKSSDVFIIGATNRPDLLDSSLMIPGRLDRLLYLGISSDHDSQLKIVEALTRKFHLGDTVNLREVVEKCPMNLTGSDFYALCSDALANSFKDRINQLEELRMKGEITEEEMDTEQGRPVQVQQSHFIEAVDSLVPSVSLDEMQYYHKVQKQFSHPTK